MSARTGFAHWWRSHVQWESTTPSCHEANQRYTAKLGWDACKEAARQAVVDELSTSRLDGSRYLGLLERIDSL